MGSLKNGSGLCSVSQQHSETLPKLPSPSRHNSELGIISIMPISA
jgi:hypothetical protein